MQPVVKLRQRMVTEPQVLEAFKEDPVAALDAESSSLTPAYFTDPWVYRVVVVALGFVVTAAVVGVILVLLYEDTPDSASLQVLTALGSAAVGALAGLLAPSPTNGASS